MNRKFYEAALLRMRSQAMEAYGRAESILDGSAKLEPDANTVDELVNSIQDLFTNENSAVVLENYFGKSVTTSDANKSLLLPEAQRFSILVEKLDVLISQTLPLVEKTAQLTEERSATLRSANKTQKIVEAAKKKQASQRKRKQKEEESGD
tara:strand:- start:4986 stop:5438 length:453 start_codon:yes stop_codon:yes gene_type:complete